MKILFFLILTYFHLLAQQNEVYQNLNNLFNKLDSDYVRYEQNNCKLNLSQKELDTLVIQIYELYSYHWIDVNNFIENRAKKNEKEYIESGGKIPLHKPVLGMVRRKLNEIKGVKFFDIITVPYYFKLKILKIDQLRKYKSGDDYYPKTTMLCEILETIKGKHLFNDGDKIEISYLNHWDVGIYEEGEIYFIPVKPWNCKNGNCTEYTMNFFPLYNGISIEGGPYGIYKIENNKIRNTEFFQISGSEWNTFKTEFKEKYILEVER